MLEPDIESALNLQLNWEQTASHEYLAMAAYFEAENLAGFARFMRRQAEEEQEHALRIFDHINDRGGRVQLDAIPQPRLDFGSTRDVFQAAYDRERANTKSINALYRQALDSGDFATQTMLHWFIAEQVEEEQWCEEALALLDTIGDNKSGLLMLDGRYGAKAEVHS